MREYEAEMAEREPVTNVRPWTVYVLAALSVAGIVWGLVVDDDRNLWDIPQLLFEVWLVYLLWTADRRAYMFLFMLNFLLAGLLGVIAFIQSDLLEEPIPSGLLWGLANCAVWIVLLMHPATKAFAGVEPRTSPSGDGAPT